MRIEFVIYELLPSEDEDYNTPRLVEYMRLNTKEEAIEKIKEGLIVYKKFQAIIIEVYTN